MWICFRHSLSDISLNSAKKRQQRQPVFTEKQVPSHAYKSGPLMISGAFHQENNITIKIFQVANTK